MITFTYTARNSQTNDLVKAEVQAENQQSAAKLLIGQGLFPIEIKNKEERGFKGLALGSGVSTNDRVVFTRQLATLINAGLPLTQSLHTAQGQMSNKTLQKIIGEITTAVEGGSTLSAAFGAHPKVFNQIYISLVAAGETSGTLDKTMDRIADQQEKDAAIVSRIRSALLYPVIVLVVILGVLVFMLTAVLPQIGGLFKDLKKTLPLQTRILIAMSNFVTHFWYLVILLLVGLFFAGRAYIGTTGGRARLDHFKMRLPVFGPLIVKVYMARFCRTLGTLMGSGVPMLEGLAIVRTAVNNVHVSESLNAAMSKVRGGTALSTALENDSNFLVLVPQMVKIGEQSGALDEMLGRAATFYENEVDTEVKNLSTTIEPALMVVLAVIIGGVIAAILLPVYGLVGTGLSG